MKNTETQQKFIELRASGASYQSIAEALQVSKQTLINWSRELSVELDNYRTLGRDHLLSHFLLAKEARLQRLGLILARLEKELNTRDLSVVPTEKLVELVLKLSNTVQKEVDPTVFKKTEVGVTFDMSTTSEWVG